MCVYVCVCVCVCLCASINDLESISVDVMKVFIVCKVL